MRALHLLILVAACQSSSRLSPPAPASVETLSANARRTTTEGVTFIAPAGWALTVRGPATILEAPERGSWIALVDVHAADADAAVERAWAAYRPHRPWKLKLATPQPAPDGWVDSRQYTYETSPAERRDVQAFAVRHEQTWTIAIYDVARAVGEKRDSQISLLFSRLLPRGTTASRLPAVRRTSSTRRASPS